jgi:hypothetical protein
MQDFKTEAENEEITLKELLFLVKEYSKEISKNWLVLCVFVVPFAGYQLYERFTKPPNYSAYLTFMVNDSQQSSVGGLLGQFRGLVGEDQDKLEKILELSKSRKTIGNALFLKAEIGNKNDFLGNHIIRLYNLHENYWLKDSSLNKFFFTRSNVDSFVLVENQALYQLHRMLVGFEGSEAMFSCSTNKKTGIMTFGLKTNNEKLTLLLIKSIFKSLSNYYIESTIRKEKESFDVLRSKKDSIGRILYQNDYASARHDDQSRGLVLETNRVPAKQYSRNNQILTILYGELIKNTEYAEFALKTATPFITAIDEPIPPLKPVGKGRSKAILLFAMIGFGLGVLFIIGRKKIRESL